MAVYEVPGMTLIPQGFTMSCWYASAQMLIQWRQDQAQASLSWLVPPDLDAECQKVRDVPRKAFGLAGCAAVESLGRSFAQLAAQLRTALGQRQIAHRSDRRIDTEALSVKVYDPSPVNQGRIEWRSLTIWYAFGTSASSRDTGSDVEAVFLFVPR